MIDNLPAGLVAGHPTAEDHPRDSPSWSHGGAGSRARRERSNGHCCCSRCQEPAIAWIACSCSAARLQGQRC
jgi:hypothetical protein